MQQIAIGIIVGILFVGLGNDEADIFSRVSLAYNYLMGSLYLPVFEVSTHVLDSLPNFILYINQFTTSNSGPVCVSRRLPHATERFTCKSSSPSRILRRKNTFSYAGAGYPSFFVEQSLSLNLSIAI